MCKRMGLRLNLEGKGWKWHMVSIGIVSTKLKRNVGIPWLNSNGKNILIVKIISNNN
jgi:hypothetical protein